MAERPGIMIYFDLEPALSMLSDAEAGQLLRAAVKYGHYGTVPEFDGLLAMAWVFVQPKIDRDNAAYQQKCIDAAYATYCREEKKKGHDPEEKDAWIMNRTISDDIAPYPTTTTVTIPNSNSSSKAEGDTSGKGDGEGSRGRRGKTSALHPLPENEETKFERLKAEKIEQLRALQ